MHSEYFGVRLLNLDLLLKSLDPYDWDSDLFAGGEQSVERWALIQWDRLSSYHAAVRLCDTPDEAYEVVAADDDYWPAALVDLQHGCWFDITRPVLCDLDAPLELDALLKS